MMKRPKKNSKPSGITALILSKYYYGVLSKNLEALGIDRYYSVLYFLNENNGCCQQTICDHLAIDKTAMVKVIRYLSRIGLVARRTNPEDRREQFITLTAKGKKEAAIVVNAFTLLDNRIFGTVNAKKREIFEEVTGKLIENLRVLPGNDLFFQYSKTESKPGTIRRSAIKKKV
jgi:DNA-binding MarR family transcriptional regulator